MTENSGSLIKAVSKLVRDGNHVQAERALLENDVLTRSEPHLTQLLIDILLVQKKWPEACEAVDRLVLITGDTSTTRISRAFAIAKLGQKKAATIELAAIDFSSLDTKNKQFWIVVSLESENFQPTFDNALTCINELGEPILTMLTEQAYRFGYIGHSKAFGEKILSDGLERKKISSRLYGAELILGDSEKASEHLTAIEEKLHRGVNDALVTDLCRLDTATCVFIHIPKTGGTSAVEAIKNIGGITLSHRAIHAGNTPPPRRYYDFYEPSFISLPLIQDKPKVINIRNIYSLLVSYYFDARRHFTYQFLIDDTIASLKYDFKDFVKYLSEKSDGWICRDLIYFPCFAQPSGTLAVDWVNRLENLEADFLALATNIGAEKAPAVEHHNKKVKEDHRQYYDDQTVDLINDTWADDIRLFGFTFEGPYSSSAILHRDVSKWRGRVSYSLTDRVLATED
jgi:hypothetical protein